MLLILLACHLYSSAPKDLLCENHAECADGSSCISNRCREVGCLSSFDCGLEQYCDEQYQCISGCRDNTDCAAGDNCFEGACAAYECRSAELDCMLGEQCIEKECVMVEPSPCTSCTYEDWEQGMGDGRECVIVSYDRTIPCDWSMDDGCPSTMSCYPADGVGLVEEGVCIHSYAFFRCTLDEDCPRGFSCAQDIYANDSDIHVCWGDCNLYRSQGWLE